MSEASPLPRLGKYELRGELGRGAMGVVHRAFDTVLRRDVALKTMTTPGADKGLTTRFLREARTAGALHHPNIVTIHELGHENGIHFISMELLEGRNLREMINSGQLPPIHNRLDMVARVCDGLDYAHRAGIVHRDIKPANIFLVSNGSLKILDFGIAKINASDATRTGLLVGTVYYMSPEQVRAVKNLDGRSDIFSAGVILYELLFRRRPFAAEDFGATLHRILHHQPPGYTLFDKILPAELADVLRRSLDKRREARFARAGEMSEALDRIAKSLQGRAGTELEERIAEIISSGLLDSKEDTDLPAVDTNAAKLMRTSAAGRGDGSRLKLALLGGLLTLAIAAVVGGRMLLEPAPEPPPEPLPIAQTLPEPTPELPPVDEVPPTTPPVEEPAAVEPDPEPAPVVEAEPPPRPKVKPLPPPPGALSVLAMPWANVEWIENVETGERLPSAETTPARLELPAGRYRLRLVNPYASRPLDVDAVVRAHETTIIRRTMPGFDAAQLANEILAVEGSRGES